MGNQAARLCEALAMGRRAMATLLLNNINLFNYLWNYCVYDIFLIRAILGIVVVVALPFIISDIMEQLQMNDHDFTELELDELSAEPRRIFSSSMVECAICTESVPLSRLFAIRSCLHEFCVTCMHQYIASKLHENIVEIKCPNENCSKLLGPEECKEIIPSHLFDRWGIALCELILGTKKFYCPFQDCSMLLINDDDHDDHDFNRDHGPNNITSSECPKCHRLFCAQCKVPWHGDMVCEEYQELTRASKNEEELRLLHNIAVQKRWQNCPNCKIYVERINGCKLIKCRCGCQFCYTCGAQMYTHNCHNCLNGYASSIYELF